MIRRSAAALLLLLSAACGSRADGGRPNVILFLADQMRADVCGPWGGGDIETPAIDRLAREGAVFERALSTYPLCTPYRGMLMTGRSPLHSGLVVNRVEASPEQNPNCLATVFADAGYDTAYIGKWHLAAGSRKYAGLIERDAEAIRRHAADVPHPEFVPPGPRRLGFRHWEAYNYHHEFDEYWFYRDEPERVTAPGYETDVQTSQALAYLRQRERDGQPFLLVVSPHPPHPPYDGTSLPPEGLAGVPAELEWPPNVPELHPRRRDPSAVRVYLAMCRNVDRNLERLLDFLDGSPLGQNTIFVFTSDHGEMHGAHGRQNKMVPYDEAVHVPLVVRWPAGIPAGRRLEVLQTPMDHLPTLAGLAGLPIPREVDGLDLSSALRGGPEPRRDAVLMMSCVSHFSFFRSGTDFPEWRAVRTPTHTYVRWLDGREELYHDAEDPWQLRDLSRRPEAADTLAELRRRLAEKMAEHDDEFLPGTAYASWYDEARELQRTALGPVR